MAKKKITPEQIAGLGLVGIIGYFLLTNGSKMIDAISGGGSGTYSGYSGSGTDLSGIPEGFFTEQQPVFNISNPEIPNIFITNGGEDGGAETEDLTKKDITTGETENKVFGLSRIPKQDSFNILNPLSWINAKPNPTPNILSNYIKPVSDSPLATGLIFPSLKKYSIWNEDNTLKTGVFSKIFINAVNTPTNPLKFLFNLGSVSAGCSGGTCKKDYNTTPAEIPFNIDLTTPNLNKPLVYGGNNTETAGVYIASLRSQNKTNGLSVWGDNPVLTRTGENTYLVTNSQNLGKYYDYSKKEYVTDFSNVERAIQSDQALKLAGGNCGSATSINQCSGVKRSVSYGNTPSSTTRYYENTVANTKKELITIEMSG